MTTFEIVPVWFASAYYVFRTGVISLFNILLTKMLSGETTAFPEGLKMRTGFDEKQNRATSTCDGSYRCEREDEGGCQGYGPTDQEEHGFLPVRGCGGDTTNRSKSKDISVKICRAGTQY